jgi:hypothetical protein
MEKRIKDLQEQIAELMQWKKSIASQQITYPLGINSTVLMQKDHFVMQKGYTFSPTQTVAIEVLLDADIYYIPGFKPS